MNTSSKWIAGLLVIILLCFIGYTSTRSRPSTQGEPVKTIKIGVIAPLTGGASIFGNSLVGGIKLAQADLRDTRNVYEIIVEDDGTNPAQAASAAQKLVNVDHVQALITVTSGTGNAAKPIVLAAHVPMICVCNDPTVGDGATTFTNLVLARDEAAQWVVEAQKQGIRSVAMISQQQAGINALTDELQKAIRAAGMTLTYADRFDGTAKDFRTTIAKAKQTQPDVYLVCAFPPSLEILAQQLKDSGASTISSTAAFAMSPQPELFEGKWYTDAKIADATLQARFEQTFPTTRFNVRTAPQGYDSFSMLVRGFETSEDAASYLAGLSSYEGKVGPITKESSSGNFRSGVALYTIKNGKAVAL